MTSTNVPASSSQNTLYLSIGALIYAIVSLVWTFIAYLAADLEFIWVSLADILVLILIGFSVSSIQRAQKMNQPAAASGLGKWFGIIFAWEGIGIGVGSGVLAGLELTEWILPWVTFVVGIHFFPLGKLLKLPLDYVLGAVFMGMIAITLIFVDVDSWAITLGLGSALLLWLAGWGRLLTARRNFK